MGYTLDLSSDNVAGIASIFLAMITYTLGIAYTKLMARSHEEILKNGKSIQVSTRSVNSVRNPFGFLIVFLVGICHIVSLTLEFGILGTTGVIYSKYPSIVLGGGRRFDTSGSEYLFTSNGTVSSIFDVAIKSCLSVEVHEDYTMMKNNFPVFDIVEGVDMSNNFNESECTSDWIGSATWSNSASVDMIVDEDSLTQFAFYGDVLIDGELETHDVKILQSTGTSRQGDIVPIVVVNNGGDIVGISISREEDNIAYSFASLDDDYTGSFSSGHYRLSTPSLAGIVTMVILGGICEGISECYSNSKYFWESEFNYGDYMYYNNVPGDEENWPQIGDYTEYNKPVSGQDYSFDVGPKDVTIFSDWFIVCSSLFVIIAIAVNVLSFFMGSNIGFGTYDGLARMATKTGFPLVGMISRNGREYVGFVSRDDFFPSDNSEKEVAYYNKA